MIFRLSFFSKSSILKILYYYRKQEDIMAGSTFGNIFKITTWGESHGKGVGVVVDGCPAGLPLSEADIQVYLDRRKPGQSKFTTPRKTMRSRSFPVSLRVRPPAHRSHWLFLTGTSSQGITVRSRPTTVRDMLTIPLTQNTVSAITGAADVPPAERRSDVLPQVPSPARS